MRNFRDHLIPSNTKIKQALIKLNELSSDAILFVVDESDRLMGSLTDGDVRRSLIKGVTIESNIDSIIQTNPKFVRKGEKNIQKIVEYRENNLRIIPVVNDAQQVVNIINFRTFRSYLPIDAIIMAGGRGSRLRPLTDTTPKPLLKIDGKPVIEHSLNRLVMFGVDDFWICLNYLGEQISDYFGNGDQRNIHIKYLWEDQPLGTIGAVSLINDFKHDYVLLTNSDILTNIDYEHFFLDFLKRDADLAVVTIPYNVDVPYAVLETNNGHILNLREKPTFTYFSNGGIYLMKTEILKNIPQGLHYNATDLMEKLIEKNKRVISYPLSGYWLDIGKHEDFEKANRDIHQIKF